MSNNGMNEGNKFQIYEECNSNKLHAPGSVFLEEDDTLMPSPTEKVSGCFSC